MKLSLFVILLFAVIINLCECTPSGSKKPKCDGESLPFPNKEHVQYSDQENTAVSGKLRHPKSIKSALKQPGQPKNTEKRVLINDTIDICKKSSLPSDDSGIFWLSDKDFELILLEKCELFHDDSAELKFIALIEDCIEQNYGMFDLLYRTVEKFSSYDRYLCQIEKDIQGKTISFPSTQKFTDFKNDNAFIERTFMKFLKSVLPAYELNEDLLKLVHSMNEKTKINSTILDKLNEEEKKVQQVWKSFWDVFGTFSMEEYMQGLSEIRKTINRLEFDRIDLEDANIDLEIILDELYLNVPMIKNALKLALKIDFEKLKEATKAFHGYARKALKFDGASSSK